MACFRRSWITEPCHSKNVSDENCFLYRSTRQVIVQFRGKVVYGGGSTLNERR